MEREVKVGRREAARVVSKRLPALVSELPRVMSSAFGEVYGFLASHGIEPKGPPFVIYHELLVDDEPMEIEICAPVHRAVDPPAGWSFHDLPAGEFATLLHVGPYDTVGAAYGSMTTWLVEHGYAPAGPPREVYLSGPETPPDEIRTIIELPVVASRRPVATG